MLFDRVSEGPIKAVRQKRLTVYFPMFRETFQLGVLPGGLGQFNTAAADSSPESAIDVKRLFDIVLGLALLLIFLPIMVAVAIMIWLSCCGRQPILYRQQRVGLNGEPFTLVKFRSMQVDAEKNGARNTAEDDLRITKVGRLIRRNRIDELPQLFQVLQGEMSLVGPRPERPEFVRYYSCKISGYNFRHQVKPGLTGLAQVHFGYGDCAKDAEYKLRYDLEYVRKHSLALDLNILLRTMPVVLSGCGAR